MGFGEAISICFRKFVVWKGRARRSEFWWFILFGIICSVAAAALDSILGLKSTDGPAGGNGPLQALVSLVLFLPNLSVTVRRLHDTNRSGFWLLGYYAVLLVSLVLIFMGAYQSATGGSPSFALLGPAVLLILGATIWYIVLMVIKGTDGPNSYGPDPFAPNQADEFN